MSAKWSHGNETSPVNNPTAYVPVEVFDSHAARRCGPFTKDLANTEASQIFSSIVEDEILAIKQIIHE